MRKGTNGLPDTSTVHTIMGAAGPVMLATAPDGDILYAGFDDDRLHRIRYVGGNLPPTAAISAVPSSGASPLTVSFSAAGSSDPEGQTLSYAWDLDGDGSFDDGTGLTRSWTYTGAAATTITARVLVSDTGGQSAVAAAAILRQRHPADGGHRHADRVTPMEGRRSDRLLGPRPRSRRTGRPAAGRRRCSGKSSSTTARRTATFTAMQTFNGVASGSFNAPDHEYPSSLELRLTVTDPTGASDRPRSRCSPQTTSLTFNTNVAAPLTLAVNGAASVTPFSRTVIVGSSNSLNAQSPQTIGGTTYTFNSWSDGLPQLHNDHCPGDADHLHGQLRRWPGDEPDRHVPGGGRQ